MHETAARARFHIKERKKQLTGSDHFLKMRSTKCTPTVARARFHVKMVKTDRVGPLFEDEVDKMCDQTVARARFHIKIVKKN